MQGSIRKLEFAFAALGYCVAASAQTGPYTEGQAAAGRSA